MQLANRLYFASVLVCLFLGAGLVIVVRSFGFVLVDPLFNLAIAFPAFATVLGLIWILASPAARRSRAVITAIVLAGAGFIVVAYMAWIL